MEQEAVANSDPILHDAAQIVQIINSFGLTGVLIVVGFLWWKAGMPGLRTAAPVPEGDGVQPPFIPPPEPVNLEPIERRLKELDSKMARMERNLVSQIAQYREETRKAQHEHEEDDHEQFKALTRQVARIEGILSVTGGESHA